MTEHKGALGRVQSGFLGSLREALAAAGREDAGRTVGPSAEKPMPALEAAASAVAAAKPSGAPSVDATQLIRKDAPGAGSGPSAADAARDARGGTPNVPPVIRAAADVTVTEEHAPTTRVIRGAAPARSAAAGSSADRDDRTQVLRGKQTVARGAFEQDPVAGWLVVVGGPGLGSFRPIYEGNNTVGRAASQRIPIDFGDDAISSEEQAYIRYDSAERAFLFVPNLAKTNIVSVNGKRPTTAVPLASMDVILMGRTQLVFVPFCGPEFDWSELTDKKS